MYSVLYTCSNEADLRSIRGSYGGSVANVAGTIMGANFPIDEDFKVYVWDGPSTASHDPPEVLWPTIDSSEPGRWIKVDLDLPPQVNADWAAGSGVSAILNKPSIPSPYTFSVGAPNSRSLSLATAYQATDNSKSSLVTVTLTSSAALTLSGGTTITGTLVIGSTNAVASGTGNVVCNYSNGLTGTVVLGVNMGNVQTASYSVMLPAGWYFAVRQTAGTGLSIVSAFDQALG